MNPADLIDDSYHPYAYLEGIYPTPPRIRLGTGTGTDIRL